VIALVRVDNRLLHGQILEAWVPRLGVERIVVADDDAAASPLARAAMLLCLPPSLSAEVSPIRKLNYAALAAGRKVTLLLFREVTTLQEAVAAGLTPSLVGKVNLGNVHYSSGRLPVTPSVFLSGEEIAAVQALAAMGFEVEARAVPSDAPVGARQLAQKYAAAAEKR
jgi:mannose/fructose/N-acetylgalactosamine-specific phosphotransferase system component IIB